MLIEPPLIPRFITGTTICGLVYKDGVILGADTRATGGNIVANKNCEKLHNLTENIYCAGAGNHLINYQNHDMMGSFSNIDV